MLYKIATMATVMESSRKAFSTSVQDEKASLEKVSSSDVQSSLGSRSRKPKLPTGWRILILVLTCLCSCESPFTMVGVTADLLA